MNRNFEKYRYHLHIYIYMDLVDANSCRENECYIYRLRKINNVNLTVILWQIVHAKIRIECFKRMQIRRRICYRQYRRHCSFSSFVVVVRKHLDIMDFENNHHCACHCRQNVRCMTK
jgi:hypothetical protein